MPSTPKPITYGSSTPSTAPRTSPLVSPPFAVSMGLCFRGVPVLGVVAVPWEGPGGTIFRAHAGGGAYCKRRTHAGGRGRDAGRHPSGQRAGLDAAPVSRAAARQGAAPQRALGGQHRLRVAYVARGTVSVDHHQRARGLWDMVAGAVLVQEAGGAVLFCNGKARRWNGWETFRRQALAAPFGQDAAALRQAARLHAGGQRAGRPRARRPDHLASASRSARQAAPARAQAAGARSGEKRNVKCAMLARGRCAPSCLISEHYTGMLQAGYDTATPLATG